MGNQGFLQLNLIDVRKEQANDPRTQISIRSSRLNREIGFNELEIPPARRFQLPAFPEERNLFCEIRPTLYRRRKSGFFTVTDGETVTRNLTVFRRPERWRAEFLFWGELGSTFDPLKQVLQASARITVPGGPSLEDFTGDRYNRVDSSAPKVLTNAKAGLLNLFAKLAEVGDPTANDRPWFSYVQEILVLKKERFIARVDSDMGKSVKTIRKTLSQFPEYKTSLAANHAKNFPARLQIRRNKMFSVKTREDHGNLQLTFAPGVDRQGQTALFLDTDIDENGKLFEHLVDVLFIHPFSGGTKPLDIHEYLGLRYPTRPLGYRPVPKSSSA